MIAEAIKTAVSFEFIEIDCVAVQHQYKSNKSTCLSILAADTERNCANGIPVGSPVCTATINMEYHRLKADEVVIKNYSENHGLLPVLLAANVVTLTDARINSPYGLLPLVKINSAAVTEV